MAIVNSSTFNFAEVMQEALASQYDIAIEAVTEIVPAVAKDAVRMLKKTAPKNTGKYAKGWAYKVETGRMHVGAKIYGKTGTYQLAHLLERKHRLRDGKQSQEYVHIKPVEDWAISEASNRLAYEIEMRSRT